MIQEEQLEKWSFGRDEERCNALLSLVLSGKKRATVSSALGYAEGEEMPKAGDESIITWWDGTPACVVRTTRVRVLPYKDISFALAVREGEDDTLESWRENHRKFFTEEGRELGYAFSEEMSIVFEEFEVVKIYGEK